MRRLLAPATAALVAIIVTLLVGTAPATAAADDLSRLKAVLTSRIDMRLAALTRDQTAIANARALASEHRDTLSSTVSSATAGLTALKSTVEAETTAAALRTDAMAMVNDYRVFTLVGPQVRLTIAADAGAKALDKAQQAHDKLAGLVAAKKDQGTDTTAAEADLADMAAAITSARGHLDGQVATLLAIKPGPDTAAIRDAVAGVRQALGAARGDLRTALDKGRDVVAFLRG
jgi:hypothetical protein